MSRAAYKPDITDAQRGVLVLHFSKRALLASTFIAGFAGAQSAAAQEAPPPSEAEAAEAQTEASAPAAKYNG